MIGLVKWMPFLMAAWCLFAGGNRWWHRRRAMTRWVAVPGVVEGASFGSTDSADWTISFATVEGRKVTGSPRASLGLGLRPKGTSARVWYDPTKPDRFEADVWAFDKYADKALLAVGAALLLVGVAFVTHSYGPY